GVVPVYPIDQASALTAYDVFDDPKGEKFSETYSKKYSSSGIYFLNHIFNTAFGIFGVFFFLFLFGDIMTKEGMDRGGSIQLLHTQPIHREKILMMKIIAVIVMTFLILLMGII